MKRFLEGLLSNTYMTDRPSKCITVHFGFHDIGFSDKSRITTLFCCPDAANIILYTAYFGYNDLPDNDTMNLTTYFLCLFHANPIEYYDFLAVCTVNCRKGIVHAWKAIIDQSI